MSFSDKTVVVTGAGKGIGRSLCIELAKNKAHVYAVSRTQKDLDELHEEYPSIHCICVDLADVEATRKHLDNIPNDVTMLVNNAAVAILDSFLETSDEEFDRTWKVNVKGYFVVSKIIGKKMVENGKRGSIVNVSSQASMVALPNHTAYCVSKGGVDQLTRMMALELGPHQIRTNAVNPTVVLTDMGRMAWSDPEKGTPMKNQIPQDKFAEVEDIVNTIMYLLSDKSDMINGVCLPIDGGFLNTRTMK